MKWTVLIILFAVVLDMVILPARSFETNKEVEFVIDPEWDGVQQSGKPREYGKMSDKMIYLKTGRSLNTEYNYQKQQNFWGRGIPARVQFPVHLAVYEQFRKGVTQKL